MAQFGCFARSSLAAGAHFTGCNPIESFDVVESSHYQAATIAITVAIHRSSFSLQEHSSVKLARESAFSNHLNHSSIRESGCRIHGMFFRGMAVVIVASVALP